MAEENKIIFDIKVQNDKAIASILEQREAIAKLKDEQKKLDVTTENGAKENEAYTATIKAKTAELKNDEKALVNNTKAMTANEGSIEANRLKLSKLTAEYVKIANPTIAQTNAIKSLSDELKRQESAIGNNTRNVGNYREAMGGAIASTGSFGAGIIGVGTAMTASPIGAFVQILSLLFQAFQKNDDIANTLKGVMAGLGVAMGHVSKWVVDLFKSLGALGETLAPFSDTIKEIGNRFLNFLLAPIMAVVKGFGAVQKALSGDITGALADASSAFKGFAKDMTFQNEKTNEYVSKLGDVINKLGGVTDASQKYALALDAIQDATFGQNLQSAKLDNQLVVLQKRLKNTTLEYKDQISILDQMEKKEKERTDSKLKLIREEIALEQEHSKTLAEGDTEREDSEHRAIELQIQEQQILGQSMAMQEKYDSQRDQFSAKELERIAKIKEELVKQSEIISALSEINIDTKTNEAEVNEEIHEEIQVKAQIRNEDAKRMDDELSANFAKNAEADTRTIVWSEKEKAQAKQAGFSIASGIASLGKELLADNFEAMKAISITEAIINTAKGVSNALGSAPPPLNFVLAGLTGALGAVQVAKIASSEPPSAAAGGGSFMTTKPTMLLVGDNPGGREKVTVTPLSGTGQTRVAKGSGLVAMAGGGSLTFDPSSMSQVGGSIGGDVANQNALNRTISDSIIRLGTPVVSVVDIKRVTNRTNVIENKAKLRA